MKQIMAFMAFIAISLSAVASDSLSVIYRIRLDSDIDKSSQRLVILGLEKAEAAGADYVMIDLDTYGGAVDAADSIRSAILRYDKPVVAYVNMQAASAGALISIACREILPYYDVALLLELSSAKLFFEAGLVDESCPPSCVSAAYNNAASQDKTIVYCPYRPHGSKGTDFRHYEDWRRDVMTVREKFIDDYLR